MTAAGPLRGERARSAATLLSTTGALVLGVGIGALIGGRLGSAAAWLIAGAGLTAHVGGMLATRRMLQNEGHRFARWETWGYWSCWALIGLGLVAALSGLFAPEGV